MRKNQRYGWCRDLPDQRDHRANLARSLTATLPNSVDLRPYCPPVYNQGQLGSCTANALAGLWQYDRIKEGAAIPMMPSRLFIYYNERAIEGTTGSDSGAQLRDGIKALATWGVPDEAVWPYVLDEFVVQPPPQAYALAKRDIIKQYQRLYPALGALQNCLATGCPWVFGFSVYESFESENVAKTGVVPIPGDNEDLLGGHAVLCVGYDNVSGRFLVRNSWGPNWGMGGYFTIPFEYLLNDGLAADFWTIQTVPL